MTIHPPRILVSGYCAGMIGSIVGTYLVLVGGSHVLDDLLALRLRNTPLLSNNLAENSVDFAGHVGRITTDINVCLLLEKVVDFLGHFLKTVLNVNLLGAFSRECCDQLEVIAKNLLVFL